MTYNAKVIEQKNFTLVLFKFKLKIIGECEHSFGIVWFNEGKLEFLKCKVWELLNFE